MGRIFSSLCHLLKRDFPINFFCCSSKLNVQLVINSAPRLNVYMLVTLLFVILTKKVKSLEQLLEVNSL